MKRLLSVIGLIVLATQLAFAQAPEGEGWTSLFNGVDLAGWKIPEGDNGHWKVVDGVIDYDARSEAKKDRNLWSEKEYGDFQLRVDWRIKEAVGEYAMKEILPDGSYKKDAEGKEIILRRPNADSGIYLRGSSKSQLNIWLWPAGSGEIWGYRTDAKQPAEVRAACAPKKNADKPVGEWNTFDITVRGDRVTVLLNGELVIDNAQLPGMPPTGPLALQHHGGPDKDGNLAPASSLVQFRNIYIKEMK